VGFFFCVQFRRTFKSTTPDADWRHPVDDIEPEESEACDSVELIGRVLRHLAGVRGLGVVALGDEAAALAALAIPEAFPGGARQPMMFLAADDRAAMLRMPDFWAWVCILGRRPRLSAIGHRTLAAIYVLRPDLLDGEPLCDIGSGSGISRQGLSKLVSDFRDCFGGVRNRTMKSDETRARCRAARRQRRIL